MLKKIKKAKKPFSWFLIICVINFVTLGFVFNVNINLGRIKINFERPKLELEVPDAKALTTATTTVTVRNAPPEWTVNPYEGPTSSTSSPTNIGDNVIFRATGNDYEANNYYLIVCSVNSVNPGAGGGAPTCGGGTTYCVSTSTPDDQAAHCSHNTAAEASESYVWYAFLCDNHTTQTDCSDGRQGNINGNGSPYIVNHGPTFTSATSSINFVNPGGMFRFSTVSFDPDIQRTASDTLKIYACDAAGASFAGGCTGNQLCTKSGSSTDIMCDYNDTAPTPDNTYNYWVYMYDQWGATATPASRTGNYTINNVAPSVGSVTLNNSSNITPNLKNAPADVTVTLYADITDQNHCSDMTQGTSTIYLSTAVNGADCAANSNDCYQITQASCGYTDCQTANATDAVARLTCTTTMAHFLIPTTEGTYVGSSWYARLTSIDDNSAKGSGSYVVPNGVEGVSVLGLDVATSSIAYGIIRSGSNTGWANSTTTIVNYGNVPLDTNVSGTWMSTSTFVIPESQQKFSLANFDWGSSGTAMSSTSPTLVDVVISRPTSLTNVTDDLYWGIGIPPGTTSGDYTGLNTFLAVKDVDGGW
jgi:hypothetical protein